MKGIAIFVLVFSNLVLFSQNKIREDRFYLKETKNVKLKGKELSYKIKKNKLSKEIIPKAPSNLVKRKQATLCSSIQFNSKLSPSKIELQAKQKIVYLTYKLKPSKIIGAKEFLQSENATKNIVYTNAKNNFNFNSSSTIVEDQNKNIWIGSSNEGIIKFDGFNYILYGKLPQQLSNEIINLYFDKTTNEVYGFTDLGFFKVRNDTLFIPKIFPSNKTLSITSYYQLSDKSILFGTKTGDLFRIKNNYIQHWGVKEGLPKNLISAISEDNNNALWLSFEGKGLYIFGKNSSKRLMLLDNRKNLKNIISILSKEKKMYLGSFANGFTILDEKDTTEYSSSGKFNETIYSIISYRNKVAFMNYSRSIVVFDKYNPSVISKESGLKAEFCHFLFSDSYDNLWIGSFVGIIQRLNSPHFYFEDMRSSSFKNLSKISSNQFNNPTYFTFQGPFFVDKGNYFEQYLTSDEKGEKRIFFINNCKKTKEHSFFISNYTKSPEKIDDKYNYKYELEGYDYQTSTHFFTDKHNRNWYQYYQNGFVYQEQMNFFRLNESDGLVSNKINLAHVDQNGNLMIFYYDKCQIVEGNRLVTYKLNSKKLDINSFHIFCNDYQNNQLYMVTRTNEIYILKNKQISRLKNYSCGDAKIVSIQIHKQKMFVFTTKGLSILTISADHQVENTQYFGVNYADFFYDAKSDVFFDKYENIYWTNQRGLLKINKDLFTEKRKKPFLKIKSINENQLLKNRSFDSNDSIIFKLDYKYWGLEKDNYIAAFLYKDDKLIQKYKLEGQSIVFSKLSIGNYKIKFQVKNPINQVLYQSKFTSFKITPRWFEATIFKLGILIVIIVLIIQFFRFRERKNNIRKKELESIIREKTKELTAKHDTLLSQNEVIFQQNKQKDALIQEIHHRVKNNLQVICILLEMQLKSKNGEDGLKESLRRIESMSIIHEMLYQNDNLIEIDTDEYLRSLIHYCTDLYKNVEKEIIVDITFDKICLDVSKSIALGMICSELFSNTVKYVSKNPIIITIKLNKVDETILFEFRDNGQSNHTNSTNLGFKLIEIFSKQLKALVSLDKANGYKYIIKFKE